MKLSADYAIQDSQANLIIALPVRHNLLHIIVVFVICGCQMMKYLTIVRIVAFVELEGEKIFVIATIVACASILYSLRITIVGQAITCQTVLSVRKIYSVLETLHMKCRAGMQYIGTVSRN